MKLISLLLLLFAGASPAAKPAWRWSSAERLAARFDDAARHARIEPRLRQRDAAKTTGNGPEVYDVLQGSEHPELLFSHEIFETFTRAAFVIDDETSANMRRDAARKAADAGLPADFIQTVAREAADFIALQRREADLRNGLAGPDANVPVVFNEIKRVRAEGCVARAAALSRLRTIYGRDQFDRYLYTALAPGVFFTFFEPQDAKQLLAEEGGCQ